MTKEVTVMMEAELNPQAFEICDEIDNIVMVL